MSSLALKMDSSSVSPSTRVSLLLREVDRTHKSQTEVQRIIKLVKREKENILYELKRYEQLFVTYNQLQKRLIDLINRRDDLTKHKLHLFKELTAAANHMKAVSNEVSCQKITEINVNNSSTNNSDKNKCVEQPVISLSCLKQPSFDKIVHIPVPNIYPKVFKDAPNLPVMNRYKKNDFHPESSDLNKKQKTVKFIAAEVINNFTGTATEESKTENTNNTIKVDNNICENEVPVERESSDQLNNCMPIEETINTSESVNTTVKPIESRDSNNNANTSCISNANSPANSKEQTDVKVLISSTDDLRVNKNFDSSKNLPSSKYRAKVQKSDSSRADTTVNRDLSAAKSANNTNVTKLLIETKNEEPKHKSNYKSKSLESISMDKNSKLKNNNTSSCKSSSKSSFINNKNKSSKVMSDLPKSIPKPTTAESDISAKSDNKNSKHTKKPNKVSECLNKNSSKNFSEIEFKTKSPSSVYYTAVKKPNYSSKTNPINEFECDSRYEHNRDKSKTYYNAKEVSDVRERRSKRRKSRHDDNNDTSRVTATNSNSGSFVVVNEIKKSREVKIELESIPLPRIESNNLLLDSNQTVRIENSSNNSNNSVEGDTKKRKSIQSFVGYCSAKKKSKDSADNCAANISQESTKNLKCEELPTNNEKIIDSEPSIVDNQNILQNSNNNFCSNTSPIEDTAKPMPSAVEPKKTSIKLKRKPVVFSVSPISIKANPVINVSISSAINVDNINKNLATKTSIQLNYDKHFNVFHSQTSERKRSGKNTFKKETLESVESSKSNDNSKETIRSELDTNEPMNKMFLSKTVRINRTNFTNNSSLSSVSSRFKSKDKKALQV